MTTFMRSYVIFVFIIVIVAVVVIVMIIIHVSLSLFVIFLAVSVGNFCSRNVSVNILFTVISVNIVASISGNAVNVTKYVIIFIYGIIGVGGWWWLWWWVIYTT